MYITLWPWGTNETEVTSLLQGCVTKYCTRNRNWSGIIKRSVLGPVGDDTLTRVNILPCSRTQVQEPRFKTLLLNLQKSYLRSCEPGLQVCLSSPPPSNKIKRERMVIRMSGFLVLTPIPSGKKKGRKGERRKNCPLSDTMYTIQHSSCLQSSRVIPLHTPKSEGGPGTIWKHHELDQENLMDNRVVLWCLSIPLLSVSLTAFPQPEKLI